MRIEGCMFPRVFIGRKMRTDAGRSFGDIKEVLRVNKSYVICEV